MLPDNADATDGAPAGPTVDDLGVARHVAMTAGRLLVARRNGLATHPKEAGAAADAASHHHIAMTLQALRPADAVLSEEGADDASRLDARRVWIVDPLDGTREYTEGDRTDWAVHVALAVDGEVVCGAVGLPALATTLLSAGEPPAAPRDGPLRVVVSRSRAPRIAAEVAKALGAEIVPMGSAGAKAAAVIRGEVDAYVHAGGQWEWDVAAPAAVALGHGLHVSRLDGSPLRFNQPRPWSPDLLVCRPELAGRILGILAARAPETGGAWG